MTAQNASLNQGIWSTLETKVRTWVALCDTLYVVTGAMITAAGDNEIQYAKDNDGRSMAIPKYYYKALAQKRGENYYTTAYKFDNISPVNQKIDAHQMTVTELEKETGFTFFPLLPKIAKDTVIVEYWR
jgi:endonuclease G